MPTECNRDLFGYEVIEGRELGVAAAELTAWRSAFLATGEAALKTRPADGRDAEIDRLKAKVGELTISTSCSTPRSSAWRRTALWHGGGRDHEP